nr:hypothetical protein CFP56_20433 [Quercus suber]
MSTGASSLPPGSHAPLLQSDADHHGSWVAICTAFGVLIIILTLMVRAYIRVKASPPFSYDDWTLTASTVMAIVQSGVVFAQIHEGFGRSIDLIPASNLVQIQKLGYTADILYTVALYLSKCCVVLLFKRISSSRLHTLTAWVVFAICSVLGCASVLLVALRCDLSQPWIRYNTNKCGRFSAQWITEVSFDILTEILLFGMALHLVWGLQVKVSRKFRIVWAFSLRLPVIAIAAIRLRYVLRQIHSSNPTLDGAINAILTQLEIFYSIMAATIPCLRPFLAGFVTNYGAMGGGTIMNGSQIGHARPHDDKVLDSKNSFPSSSSHSRENHAPAATNNRSPANGYGYGNDHVPLGLLRPDRAEVTATISHGVRSPHDALSTDSNDSRRMIIKKEVDVQIDRDGDSILESRSPGLRRV